MAERYEFGFTWDSPYGRIVRLLEAHVAAGKVVLDLGCGYGAVAEPLLDLGYEYVGCDADAVALESLRQRGLESHQIDLADLDGLADRLTKIAGDRPVGAVLMLDALEHLPDTDGFLDELRACVLRLDRPMLGLSIPNVGHFDVGAKLVMGSWDVTPSGLLDETHVQFFTERRLRSVLRRGAWFEVDRRDLLMHHSDQHFPADHPVLADATPLRNLLWNLRRRTGDELTVNQFVRLFALASADVVPARPPADGPGPFLSVLMRTRGTRMHNLLEALVCLAAQTDDDFVVQLLVHTARRDVFQGVRNLVESFDPRFAGKVNVHQVQEGGRACPLNVGLTASERARYVAFLDDDDLVTADWVERFRCGAVAAPGQIVRSVTVDQAVRRNDDDRLLAPYHPVAGLFATHNPVFNAVEHFSRNRTPICSFAVPMEAVRSLGARFAEDAPVLEDWQFLLNLALVCGVHDTGVVTSIYHRWVDDEGSAGLVDQEVWDTTQRAIVHRLDTGPLLLPPGSASQIADLWEKSLVLERELPAIEHDRAELRQALDAAYARIDRLEAEREALAREVGLARQDAADVRSSTTWRATAPARQLAGLARSARTARRRPPAPS